MDTYLFNLINQFALKWHWLDALGIFFASYFQYVVAVSLLLFLAVNFKKYWKVVSLAAFSAIFARTFIELIYLVYPKMRPFGVMEVNRLVSHSAENAFPSGHATFFFALATIIFLYNKKAGLAYFLMAILIFLARVFSGIHWPADILGGAVVGILIALILNKIYDQVFNTRC